MSKLREEIERRLAQTDLFKEKSKADDATENASAAPENEAPVEEVHAPYDDVKFAADFVNLSPEWQSFLQAREAEVNRVLAACADRLSKYAAVERLYQAHCARTHQQGAQKLEEWLSGIKQIDASLQVNPMETLCAIALCYGIALRSKTPINGALTREIVGRLCELERSYFGLKDAMQQQHAQRLADTVKLFGSQKNADGEPAHPYFEAVRQQIFELLNSGAAHDVAEAYEQALWLNPLVREELIKQKINKRAVEAERAKQASFTPKGKAQAPEKKLTLREEIEKNMALMGSF